MTQDPVAHYRCLGCGVTWRAALGPTTCPACGHLYIKWENFNGS